MNFIIKKIFAVTIIITVSFAQTIDPLKLVFELNPEVKAAELAYQSALGKVKTAGVLPDPMIETSFSINPIETRNGPIDNQIMLGQKFPFFGKLKRERNIERIKADIAKLSLDNTKLNISHLLNKYVAEYHKNLNSIKILKEFQEELISFKSSAQNNYANGLGFTQHPIIKLQIEESLVETKINGLESALEKNINNLQVLFDGQFSPSQINSDSKLTLSSLSGNYWIDKTNLSSPRYLMAQARVAVATDQYKLSKLKNYPDLIAGMTYSMVGPTDLGGAVSSGADGLGVKVGINLPLWFGKNKARVQAASFTQNQQEEILLDTWNKIESDILSILKEISEVNETYLLYDKNIINETEQMLSSAYSAYETGKISFLDLLDSVRMGVKVKLEFESIKAKQTTLISKLYQSAGIDNPSQEN